MTDFFAVLGEPRCVWLDADKLKEKFHRLAMQLHPDAAGGDATAFATLNAAYATLREPASRLRHFLELENPDALRKSPEIPLALVELFGAVGNLRQRVATFLVRADSETALTRALLAPERVALSREIESQLERIAREEAALAEQLKTAPAIGNLSQIWPQFSFFRRWREQLEELAARLRM